MKFRRLSKLEWLFVSLAVAFLGMLLSKWFEWAEYIVYAGWLYPTLFTLYAITHAWIINPYNDYMKNKKK
jgi:hypothetical protein